MSKALKITVLAASALLLVGITLWTVGGIRSGSFFPLRKGSETVEQREKQFDEAIKRVQIEEVSAEVELYPAEDGVCRVVYSETERQGRHAFSEAEERQQLGLLLLWLSGAGVWPDQALSAGGGL